jgi:hypothetical protein
VKTKRQMLAEAARLFEDFTGHKAHKVTRGRVHVPAVGLLVGKCDGIQYTTVRDGRVEHYVHEFAPGSRPLLLASHDGKSLVLLGGAYRFTDSGINDI